MKLIKEFSEFKYPRIFRFCDLCGKKYEHDYRQKSKYCSKKCGSIANKQKKLNGIENVDYVICQMCGLKFKEINFDHLFDKHRITCEEYDMMFGENKRVSEKTKIKKNTLTDLMSPEFSKKLSHSHTLDNYIEKYGEENGKLRYKNMLDRKKYKNGLSSYIDKFGEEEGLKKFKDVQMKKAITLENQIKLYGEEIGNQNYKNWLDKQKIKNTITYFIKLYGYEEGMEKWIQKNDKISIANSKIDNSLRDIFKNYMIDVDKYTRISLNMNSLLMVELRGLENKYDLDHIVSKIDGFKNNIPPYIIGHISNLKIVDSSYNRSKRDKSDVEIKYIVDNYEKDQEYQKLINKIKNIKDEKNIIREFSEFKNDNIVFIASEFIKNQIKNTEWENLVYVAGGAVRDELMGYEPKDLDLLIDKENGGIDFADWITKKLGIYRDGANPVVYPRFGTAKFNFRGIKYGGYDLSTLDIESVMPRSEKYEPGSRKPDVGFSSLKMDSERRDQTINSLFKNLSTGEILDFTKMGKEDLKRGIVRTPLDPDIIFGEDPLRMLRAIRTTCKYNFDLPMSMIRSIKKNAKKIMYISFERISDELSKMLLTEHPDKAIRLILMTKLSKHIFPELEKLDGLGQNKYHDMDVLGHTLKVLRNTPPTLIVRLAGLFHDIGKYKTVTVDDGETHFYGHEEMSAHIAKDILHRLKFPRVIINPVCDIIANHMRTKPAGNEGIMSNRSLRKLRNDMGENLEYLLDLIHADNISHAPDHCMPKQIPNIRKKLAALEEEKAPIKPPINGDDIQNILKIGKGPVVGKLLDKLKDLYLDNPHMTKEEAEEIIKKLYKNI